MFYLHIFLAIKFSSSSIFYYPSMIAIADTNTFIKRNLNQYIYTAIYVPTLVHNEIIDKCTKEYFSSFYNIEIKDPSNFNIEIVSKMQQSHNLMLSLADIHLLTLVLELNQRYDVWLSSKDSTVCLTEDKGILEGLTILGLSGGVQEKKWVFRCYTCFEIYEEKIEFCKCGYQTITRISLREEKGKTVLNLKKNFRYRSKELMGKNGKVIISPDQREYHELKKERKREAKKIDKMMLFWN